ncbi:hypothetical protein KIN20_004181 [Parelaphostrongylus tenuis]|uniref:Uncharacterized protein n=1 Tax=Parelaphostrongylus tenuis TaxID=148309 RepID=A0AAD5QGQ3_PARTN|nr:hypothetical protein KIN20_004181 [Parelaphostrongylus tenuis]
MSGNQLLWASQCSVCTKPLGKNNLSQKHVRSRNGHGDDPKAGQRRQSDSEKKAHLKEADLGGGDVNTTDYRRLSKVELVRSLLNPTLCHPSGKAWEKFRFARYTAGEQALLRKEKSEADRAVAGLVGHKNHKQNIAQRFSKSEHSIDLTLIIVVTKICLE